MRFLKLIIFVCCSSIVVGCAQDQATLFGMIKMSEAIYDEVQHQKKLDKMPSCNNLSGQKKRDCIKQANELSKLMEKHIDRKDSAFVSNSSS